MNQDIINKIFQEFSKLDKEPKTELNYTNNFTLAVAVILSAQATDISVNKATEKLFQNYDTPEKMVKLGEDGLKQYIKTIGLFNAKAKNVIAMCEVLIDKYNSILPNKFEELIKLPGIGRKTANVILNCAFGHKTIAVDTHVFRVANRIGLACAKTPEKVEMELLKNLPDQWLTYAHHWLILHGRYVCKARKPNCPRCAVKDYCEYYANTKFHF